METNTVDLVPIQDGESPILNATDEGATHADMEVRKEREEEAREAMEAATADLDENKNGQQKPKGNFEKKKGFCGIFNFSFGHFSCVIFCKWFSIWYSLRLFFYR